MICLVEEEKKRLKDVVMEKISSGASKRIPITFPKDVFLEFDEFSKQHANHCYWLAVKYLLEEFKRQEVMDSKTLMLIERDNQLASDITKLKQRIDELEEALVQKKTERRTFGKKEKEVEKDEK